MAVMAARTTEELTQELRRAEQILARLRERHAPWESVHLAEREIQTLRRQATAMRRIEMRVVLLTTPAARVPATLAS